MAATSTPPSTAISEALSAAVGGDGPSEARWASALRLRCQLQPAGGPGAKVMPPTYSSTDGPTYIDEHRRIDGEDHECTLLDGIASQANRIEEALASRVALGEVPLPTIEVSQSEFGLHSGLEFSHRCFDAWIEDAHLAEGQSAGEAGTRFGETDLFKRLTGSPSRHDLTALLETFPVGILLGCWASRKKNPQGTTRLARILSSEIVAVDSVLGSRPASRIDRHHVSAAAKLFVPSEPGDRFTLDEERALNDKGKPKLFTTGEDKGKDGKPSAAGYGNVTPSKAAHGGITMDHALQIATVSMPALRECGFPDAEGGRDPGRDVAGRQMLAALALRMLALQVEHGYDLRSGCLLVPEQEPTVELVGRLGRQVASWPLIEMSTEELLAGAIANGMAHGLTWASQKIELIASEAQLTLLRRSLSDSDAESTD